MAAPASASKTDPARDIPVAIGDVIADKYRLQRIVGAGGVGVVFAAEHLTLGEPVAIKLLQRAAAESSENLARFDREARALARVKSEHVARIMDFGALPTGEPYMVIELLEGSDFSAVLRERQRLPIEEAVDFVVQACEAVALSHGVGIVHRDLKPANLFLTKSADGTPIVKVLDFGISKLRTPEAGRDQAVTQTMSVVGSPLYMSPEQMETPKDADERADMWSIGVILYELITGKPPFEASTLPLLLARICTSPPTPMAEHGVVVPEGLERVIVRCLAKDPAQRFQSVAALARDLAPFGVAATMVRAHRIVRASTLSNAALDFPADVDAASPDDLGQASPDSSGARRLAWDSSPPPPLEARRPVARASRLPWALAFGVLLLGAGGMARRASAPEPRALAGGWVDELVLEVQLRREVELRERLLERSSSSASEPTVSPALPAAADPSTAAVDAKGDATPSGSIGTAASAKGRPKKPREKSPAAARPDDVLSER